MKAKAVFLVDRLGITYVEAHHKIRAYESRRVDPDADPVTFRQWVAWLAETPGGRKPRITRDHRLKVVPS